MSISGILPTAICIVVFFATMVAYAIYVTRARIRYVSFTNELRRSGEYKTWSKKHKVLLFLENLSVFAAIVSVLGFIATGVLNLLEIARLLFLCFIIFSLSGISSALMLFRKVPKSWNGSKLNL